MHQRGPHHLLTGDAVITAKRNARVGCGRLRSVDDDDSGSGSLEMTVIAAALFLLIGLGLLTCVNLIAARTASAAAQRGLQVAQTPGGTPAEARQVVARMAASTGFVTGTRVQIADNADTVTVDVELQTVLGSSVTRSVSGPRLRFIPQSR